MTQAAVNNAIVLYRLAVERRDVEEAQRVYFVTEKLAQTLANPLIPLPIAFATASFAANLPA